MFSIQKIAKQTALMTPIQKISKQTVPMLSVQKLLNKLFQCLQLEKYQKLLMFKIFKLKLSQYPPFKKYQNLTEQIASMLFFQKISKTRKTNYVKLSQF